MKGRFEGLCPYPFVPEGFTSVSLFLSGIISLMDGLHEGELNDLKELIRHYGLEEDEEYVIINLKNSSGKKRKIYLLKRRYMRIVKPDGSFEDYPLKEVIEAILRYPTIRLSDALMWKKLEEENK